MPRRKKPQKYGKAVDDLLALGKNANEAMIKDRILKLLDVDEINYSLEYKSGVGPTDIHLMHRCTIIETKTAKRLEKGPYEPGSGSKKQVRVTMSNPPMNNLCVMSTHIKNSVC